MTTMTQCRLLFPLWLASLLLATPASANQQYNQGSEFAKGIKGQEQAAIGGFDPTGALPSYTSAPPESGYYGGVTNASTDLTSQGNAALNQSEVGKTITESILNTPAGNKPSMDAPFISVGTDAQDKAESVTDGSFDGCVEQEVTHTEYTNHVCSRDTRVDQYCARTATIEGDWVGSTYDYPVTIPHGAIRYAVSGSNVTFSFTSPVSGTIRYAKLHFNRNRNFTHYPTSISFLNSSYGEFKSTGVYPLSGAPGMTVNAGAIYTGTMRSNHSTGSASSYLQRYFVDGDYTYAIEIVVAVNDRVFNPKIVWRESCPFDKAEGALTNSQCTEPGGNRTIYVEGKPYTMYSDCWAYKDTYLTQSQSEGTCREYMNNPACTIANRQCAYTLDGFCLHENLTYSCEHKTTGAGVMCGPAKTTPFKRQCHNWPLSPQPAKTWQISMARTCGHSLARLSTARSSLPALATAAKTPAGARMWGSLVAAARKRLSGRPASASSPSISASSAARRYSESVSRKSVATAFLSQNWRRSFSNKGGSGSLGSALVAHPHLIAVGSPWMSYKTSSLTASTSVTSTKTCKTAPQFPRTMPCSSASSSRSKTK